MSKATPITELSSSPKYLVLVLGLVLMLSSASGGQAAAEQSDAIYSNRAGASLLTKSVAKKMTITAADKKLKLSPDELTAFGKTQSDALTAARPADLAGYFFSQTGTAHPWSAYNYRTKVSGFGFNESGLGSWLMKQGAVVNQDARDAELKIENHKAVVFVPHQDGRVLDLAASKNTLEQDLLARRNQSALILSTQSPKVYLSVLNDLGINMLLARGQSDFSGSTATRIVNIGVGASQFNGIIIAPGEEFSFNKYLGTITEEKGYVPELVIKREGVDKELGGGLCQVATTAFRAAFFSGLPITARRNHSYAVHYYEWINDEVPAAVGLDATIYPGAQDMKFINDTPAYILVWTKIEGRKLFFDFYGTKDGREVTMDGPHPYDKKPDGAVRSTVSRTVVRDGVVQTSVFKSNYVSPNLYPKLFEIPKAEPSIINPEPTQ